MKHSSRRRPHLARIHALTKELGLTEAAYRNVLASLTGQRSAADLDEHGRMKVINFLTSEITNRNPTPPTTPAPAAARVPEVVTDEEALEILGMAA